MTTGEPEPQERRFDHREIEPAWQAAWDDADVFRIEDDETDPEYVLAMFPYTSGNLHMGHVRNYTITDAYARFERMRGESVLHPMGWDSFGLPAENAAEERDTNPRDWTLSCIDSMKEQLNRMGFGYDWEREVTTCDPDYYRWNQWFFQRFREEGLVDRRAEEINWCPSCETVLADEQVETPDGDAGSGEGGVTGEGICWRCDSVVETRELDQWVFTITDYADELLEALDDLDGWPNNVREMQRNWIGRQEGDSVEFELTTGDSVEIFTTRLDTIHGATFFAMSPGHEVAQRMAENPEEYPEVAEYVERAEALGDDEELPETSGAFTGEFATNPATGEEIPVYVADYVLEDVGTGALYAVPAHDDRDHAFAEEHEIPIQQVVEPAADADADPESIDVQEAAYTPDGILINSGEYDGLESAAAREEFVDVFDGEHRVEFRLRDWLISRQRYWGTPIPMIDCEDCGYVPVPEDDLPVELPEFVHTTGNPLDAAEDWKHVDCPECGGDAVRETDTMDTFVDSSWYFLRYCSPDLDDAPFDHDRASDWMPVDQYVGGIEHAVMHLLYARFFTKMLDDMDLLSGTREPFTNLTNQGMVLGEDGNKMSKSRGNGVSPQRMIDEYGADTARLFTMEAAQPQKEFAWSPEGVESAHQYLQGVYDLATRVEEGAFEDSADGDGEGVAAYVERETDATVATATEEYEAFRFNHALQSTRELVSLLRRYADRDDATQEPIERGIDTVARILGPVAPHVTEEIWSLLDRDGLLAEASWPDAEPPADYEIEARLVENTREDVRDIVDVADIEDPQRIEVAVAPQWKHDAIEIATNADGDVVGAVMSDEDLQRHGNEAADFAKDLAGNAEAIDEQLSPEGELAALERAAWLLRDEFGADVEILSAADADDDLASKAEPGRPAIHIEE
ncbi:leucyl-tRNA ligase [Salinarchaeum sp. Harcht-Bsk1]|uniref:leucine--tRNA ligase n=1 Tax=Salinarchaeum sp. Harcht-Bsk1 TaxID=1333523 RepID=UPI0003422B1E|nr:leucine--tRNA ligase [Salinarchaeum sp. Harcht-Bsk1]AGN01572.1 leucyl-tRNA ligase [Salinarchaeum sp. Harcht-Bsk1]